MEDKTQARIALAVELDRKLRRLDALRRRVHVLETDTNALKRSLEIMGGKPEELQHDGLTQTRGMSIPATIEVLRESGQPLHADEIITRLNVKGIDIQKQSLTSNLSRLVINADTFYRADSNTFGLLEWQSRVGE